MKKLLCAVTVLAVSTAQAATIHVDIANCPGPGNGSEAEPYCSIQTAIDNAVDTDEIVVAPGTYFETITFLGKAITLRSSDGPEVTVIDGSGFFHVVQCVSGEGSETVLDGFTITGGNANGDVFPDNVGGGMFISDSGPTVMNCVFSGSIAGAGGGMYHSNSTPTVADCIFIGNMGSFGGSGGALVVTNDSIANLVNCLFVGNSSPVGGAIYCCCSAQAFLTNCTFSQNSATSGGAVAVFGGGNMHLRNCILWGNNPDQIVIINFGFIVVVSSDVQGGWGSNIDADPLFVNPDNGDYRLLPGSPCIDAGDNTAVPEDITTDLDGNPRFLEIPETPDTGNGTLPIVDMGAYESLGGGCLAVTSQEVVCHADGTTFTVNIEGLNACTGGTTQVTFTASGGAVGEELCFTALVNDGGFCCSTEICVTIPDCTPVGLPSDLNGDGIVGIVDWLALLADWGSCSDCGNCPADFDGDCLVGIFDLLVLLGDWGPC